MQQPSHDLTTAEWIAGFVLSAIAAIVSVLQLLPGTRQRRHRKELEHIRRLVEEAFAMELARGAHSAVVAAEVSVRVDELEERMAHSAELLEQIPILVAGQLVISADVAETKRDIKLILQQLGQVQGLRSHFPPLAP